jgi:hypothetical protein
MAATDSAPIQFNRRLQMIIDSVYRPYSNILLLVKVTSMSAFFYGIKVHPKLHDSKLLQDGALFMQLFL